MNHNSPESQTALEQALTTLELLDPLNTAAQLGRIELAIQGDPFRGIEGFSQMLKRSDLTPANRAAQLRQRSRLYRVTGDVASALNDLEEAIRLDPTNAENMWGLSLVLLRAERGQEAITRARQAVALEPENWMIRSNYGDVLARLGQWQEALAPFAKSCNDIQDQYNCAQFAIALHHTG